MPWYGQNFSRQAGSVLARDLNVAAEYLLSRSVPRAPLRDGPLRASGAVEEASPDDLEAYVTYDTPYAVKQHEDLDLSHPLDGEAKYLERPLVEDSPVLVKIMGRGLGGIQ